MIQLNEKQRPDMKFLQMDALKMSFEDETFTVALDKGTLDALMPDENPETNEKITNYFKEIQRTLKIGGRYICISLLQEHILKKILNYFPSNDWMLRIVRTFNPEKKAIEANANTMPVFIVICTKFKNLTTKILEVDISGGEKMQRLKNIDEMDSIIKEVQNVAFICSVLQKTSIADQNEISFDLYKPDFPSPRYTIYIIDLPPDKEFGVYAAFIVPQGRESEWMFSTKEGHKLLAKMTNYNRLAIVTLNPDHQYGSLEDVQNEIGESIKNFSPANLTGKVILITLKNYLLKFHFRSHFYLLDLILETVIFVMKELQIFQGTM